MHVLLPWAVMPCSTHHLDFADMTADAVPGEQLPSGSGAGSAGKGKGSRRTAGSRVSAASVWSGNQINENILCRRYSPLFIWGQLSGWFKQTVYDPTASLSAERRGTLSLPDIECCYGSRRYNAKVRASVLLWLVLCRHGIAARAAPASR